MPLAANASQCAKETGGNVIPPLQRGKACIRCRRRKMRCDSARPVCSQCTQARCEDDCEYTDQVGPTRTQLLEENILELETRIRELESRNANALGLGVQILQRAQPLPGTGSLASAVWDEEYIPVQISDTLVRIFLQHSASLGFALDIERFQNEAGLPNEHLHRPHESLLSVVFAWGIRFTLAPELKAKEESLIQKALIGVQSASLVAPGADDFASKKYIQLVQAEILLANYFFCLGQTVEGHYHSNAAVTLAVSCGLHQIGSPVPVSRPASATGLIRGAMELRPTQNARDFSERVRVFWEVFNVDSCWNASFKLTRAISDVWSRGTLIASPWPLDSSLADYPPAPIGESKCTVLNFLSGNPSSAGPDGITSFSSSRAKASALFSRAAELHARTERQQGPVADEIRVLARITTQFAQSLMPLDHAFSNGVLPEGFRGKTIVSHCLAHAAMIHLHLAKGPVTAERSSALVNHAQEVFSILDLFSKDASNRVHSLDPVLANIGFQAGCILARSLTRSAEARNAVDVLMRCAGPEEVFPLFAHKAFELEEIVTQDH